MRLRISQRIENHFGRISSLKYVYQLMTVNNESWSRNVSSSLVEIPFCIVRQASPERDLGAFVMASGQSRIRLAKCVTGKVRITKFDELILDFSDRVVQLINSLLR